MLNTYQVRHRNFLENGIELAHCKLNSSLRSLSALPVKLLRKSASVCGFFLLSYPQKWEEAFGTLSDLYAEGKLKSFVDQGQNWENGNLTGIDSIPDAVEYMYSRKSIGKVFVDLFPSDTANL